MIIRHPLTRPRRGSFEAFAWSLETPLGLVAMFALAFLLRLAIAPYLGFHGDLRNLQLWANRVASVGPRHFYQPHIFLDYPPGALYILWVLGKISATPSYLLLKLPTIFADLGLAWIAGVYATRIAPESLKRRLPVRALVAASVLFNPAVLAVGAVWGQLDSIPTLFALWSLLLLFTGPKTLRREIEAFLLFAVAIAIKPQVAFVLPVMLYALYRRYLHHRAGKELLDGALNVALVGVPALALWAISGVQFGLSPLGLFRLDRHSADAFPYTSLNAFNLWGVFGFWRNDSTGTDVLRIAGVPALYLGTVLFLAAVVAVLWRVHRALDRGAAEARVFTVGAAAVSLAAFILLTRMHERYMFLALMCLAPLVVARPIRRWYAVLCGLFVVNLWYAYAVDNAQFRVQTLAPQPVFRWLFGPLTSLQPWQGKVWSVAVTATAAMLVYRSFGWAERPVAATAAEDVSPAPDAALPAARPVARMPSVALPSLEFRLPTRERLMRFAWSLDTGRGLLAMFAVALGIRLAIAPWVGFYPDLLLFRQWSEALARFGPHRFYSSQSFIDYPPGYLYVLWLLGKISAAPSYLLLKLPSLLSDLGLAYVAATLAARIAPPAVARRVPLRPLVAAAVLFNPAFLFESGVFGQVNAVPAFFVLLGFLLLLTGTPTLKRDVGALAAFGAAFAIKPQACFSLPVVAYVLYRRYLYGRSRPELLDGALRAALVALTGLVVWLVSALPFGLSPTGLLRFYSKASAAHPWTSSDAYNLWGILGSWRADKTGEHVYKLAGVPAFYIGWLLFFAAVAYVLVRTHRALEAGSDSPSSLLFAAALMSLLGYVLLTRMHEHYIFPAVALLAPLIFIRQIRWTYVVLSLFLLMGIWFSFVGYNLEAHVETLRVEPLFTGLYGNFSDFTWQTRLYSFVVTAIALMLAWRGFALFAGDSPEPLPQTEPKLLPQPHIPTAALVAAGSSGKLPLPTPGEPEPATESREPKPVPRLQLPADWRSWLESVSSIGLAEHPEDESAKRWSLARLLPLSLVGFASAFGLIVLRNETHTAPNLNDSAFHLLMVRWASGQIHQGRVPLDGWFPYLSMGSSFFHHYQSLAETLTAYTSHLTGAGTQTTYDWFLYLLVALWPICVYISARLFEWGRWPSAAIAVVAPQNVSTPGYGYEWGSYGWQGYGVYSQMWAMWVLPLAWGLTWKAVVRGKYYAGAALAMALTVAIHFMTGYVAELTIVVWVILLGGGYLRRAARAALVVCSSALIAAWVIVPLLADEKWTTQTEYYKRTFINDGYGAKSMLTWLFNGQLFDAGRFPIFTILFWVGLVVCLARVRNDLRARALVGVFAFNLLLSFGRRTFGGLMNLLPGAADAELNRFIIGVNLAGIFIAGIGLAWLAPAAYRTARWIITGRLDVGRYVVAGAAAVVVAVAVLEPAWAERVSYTNHGAALMRSQQQSDAAQGPALDKLLAIVKKRHDGRVYAGMKNNWGADYKVGYVPVYAWLADDRVDAIGFTFRTIASLSTDVEAAFDESNPAQYQMFNIRYLLLPSDHQPPVPAKLIAKSGGNDLYRVATTGYFQVVDRSAAIAENRTNIQQNSLAWRASHLASKAVYPGIAFAGASAPAPTFSGSTPPPGSPGRVVRQSNVLADGKFDAVVRANRNSVVLLKASYDPRWSVTVDGQKAKTEMMAPSLVGVVVPPGVHSVRFHYTPYGHYPLLLAIGLLTLIGLVLFPRRERIVRRVALLRQGA